MSKGNILGKAIKKGKKQERRFISMLIAHHRLDKLESGDLEARQRLCDYIRMVCAKSRRGGVFVTNLILDKEG